MANKLTDYSATNSLNTDVGGINIDEGMLPSDVNNAIREVMTHLKDFAEGTQAVNSISVTGNVSMGSASTTGNITFGDNDKAIFGAGSDLQIYHDGTNSFVTDAGTGNLRLQGSNYILIEDASGVDMMYGHAGAEVGLNYNGAVKLTTTSGGIDVTGTVTADGLQIDGDSTFEASSSSTTITKDWASLGGAALRLHNSDSTTNNFEGIVFTSRGSTTDADQAGGGIFSVNTSRGGVYPTADLDFYTTNGAGSFQKRMSLDSDGDVSLYDSTGVTQGFFWDASTQRLGLGSTSPSAHLQVNGSLGNNTAILTDRNGTAAVTVDQYGTTTFANQVIASNLATNSSGTDMTFSQGASEAMRISSGNLLVAKTSANTTDRGVVLRNNGEVYATQDGDKCLVLNRKTSNGQIASFRKDNIEVGSIGVDADSTNLMIGNGVVGLRFVEGSNHIRPANTDTGGNRDNAIDLGYGSSRFKDLYLSGGVYLGGTGASNLLDDYEEGTYNPTLTASGGTFTLAGSFDTMSYTKIGRKVTICGRVQIGSVSGSPTGTVYFSLPFSVFSGTESSAHTAFQVYTYGVDLAASAVSTFGETSAGSSSVGLLYQVDDGGWGGIGAGGYSAGDLIYVNGTYFTA